MFFFWESAVNIFEKKKTREAVGFGPGGLNKSRAEKMEAIINNQSRRSCIKKALLVFALVVTTVSAVSSAAASSGKPKDGWTVRQLLTQHFPHRISDDIYLDPCKAGKKYVNRTFAKRLWRQCLSSSNSLVFSCVFFFLLLLHPPTLPTYYWNGKWRGVAYKFCCCLDTWLS